MAFNTAALKLVAANNQYAYITDAAQTYLDEGSDLTIELWVKFNSVPSNGQLFSLVSKYNTGSNQRSYGIFYVTDNSYGNYLEMTASNNGSNRDSIRFLWTPELNTWYHIAITFDVSQAAETESELFINGISQGNGAVVLDGKITSIYNSNANFAIGAWYLSGNATGFFDGSIDEVRIWSYVRSSSQILDNLNTEINPDGLEGLDGYWRFNETALDEASGNNHLTLSGSPIYDSDVPFNPLVIIKQPKEGGGGAGMRATVVRPKNETVKWSEKQAAAEINRLRPQNTVVKKAAVPHTKRLINKKIRNPYA